MQTNKLLYFPWYPDAFFPSVAFNLLAPFLKKLAPKKDLQGPLWPSSKIFWLKHCSWSRVGYNLRGKWPEYK